MDDPLETWFVQQILAHEPALTRYLRRMWRHPEDLHDLRQEIYVRVYEAAAKEIPQSPKSFLFTTARNLITDRIRRERVVSIEMREDIDALNVLVEDRSPEKHASATQELHRVAVAFDQLPRRCREVTWMRRVEGLAQREVAERLGIAEGMVEKHVAKAMRRLADALFGLPQGAARSMKRSKPLGKETKNVD